MEDNLNKNRKALGCYQLSSFISQSNEKLLGGDILLVDHASDVKPSLSQRALQFELKLKRYQCGLSYGNKMADTFESAYVMV